jgi:hypothetical protein
LKPLILFVHFGGLDIHDIDIGTRPTRDASVLGGVKCGNDIVDEQGFGCCKIMLVGSVSGMFQWLCFGLLLMSSRSVYVLQSVPI